MTTFLHFHGYLPVIPKGCASNTPRATTPYQNNEQYKNSASPLHDLALTWGHERF
jgi:hypothetical protein